jgi:nucleobase:cation symporter-1, NCS1 family
VSINLGAKVSKAAQELGDLGWMLSFVSSFFVYLALCTVWPTRNQKLIREMGLRFEEMSYKEIVAADGTVITEEQEGYPDPRRSQGNEKNVGTIVGDASKLP